MLGFGQLKISQLTSNPSITGAEVFPLAKSGSNYKESFANLKTWIQSDSLSSDIIINDSDVPAATTVSDALTGLWADHLSFSNLIAARWTTTGNGATSAGTNFIGTIDSVALVIKTNSQQVMKFWPARYRADYGDFQLANLFLGYNAGASNTDGFRCTMIGSYAGTSNTTGDWNTFIGDTAGTFNTTGERNTFIGHAAGMTSVDGNSNVAIGVNSYEFGTSADNGTCVGDGAGRNITSDDATCIGAFSATSATSADNTTAIGRGSCRILTTGDNNTAIGLGSAFSITTGADNFFGGYNSGASFGTSSTDNIIIGSAAGDGTADARTNCIMLGTNVGTNNQGDNCIAFGKRAGLTWTTITAVDFNNVVSIGGGPASRANEVNIGGYAYSIGMVNYNYLSLNGRFTPTPSSTHTVTIQVASVTDSAFSTTVAGSTLFGAKQTNGSSTANLNLAVSQSTGTGTSGNINFMSAPAGTVSNAVQNALDTALTITGEGDINYGGAVIQSINTTAGDAATINFLRGRFRKDTSGSTFTLTSKYITANSIIMLTPANSGIDASATTWTASAGAGSATIKFNADPTSNFDMNFFIAN